MSIVYGALLCSAPALEEFDLASDLPFLVDSGPNGSKTVDGIAELRVLHLDGCYLPANSFPFHVGLTHIQLFGSQSMWPALESMLSTLALVPKLRILELYSVFPSDDLPSSDPPSTNLPSLKELHLGGTGQSISSVIKKNCSWLGLLRRSEGKLRASLAFETLASE